MDSESEGSTNPSHKRKYIDPSNNECLAPKSPLLSSPPLTLSITIDPTQSTSERARERYLKQDPLALVLNPSSVECRQCKKKIKLSSKSAYDPFHWRNHRTRCMKAHKRKVKIMNKASFTLKKSSTPPMDARLSPLHKGSLMHTPPLISDCDDDRVSDHSGEFANSPPIPSTSFAPPKQEPSFVYSSLDTTFNDYLRRSHPDYSQPAASVQTNGLWRNWSWAQLKPPLFPVTDDDNYDDDMDEGPFEIPLDIFRRAAASSLSFVS